jgi:hypothetical protein
MMLIQIGLTVTAWRKGWGPKSLVPLGIVVGVAFLTGISLTFSGISSNGVLTAIAIPLDLGGAIALLVMSLRAPKSGRANAVPAVVIPSGAPAATAKL